jgi:hypothetical protein
MHAYEVRLRKYHRGVDLISDVLWYGEPNAVRNAVGYAKFRSRSHDAVIRVYDSSRQRDRNAQAQGRFSKPGESGGVEANKHSFAKARP